MSALGAWLWGTSQLDDAIDKATSELLPTGSEDIALNLEICDQIRSKSAPAKDAMRALKRRLNHKNPNVQLLTLGLTDVCVKNGGDHFLIEVASREFIDNLVSILKIPGLNYEVKNTILRLVQNWSMAFEGKYSLGYVGQVYKTLQGEGYKFPPKDLALANSAMVDTQTAPEWSDSDICLRCRTAFTFTNRKHHCRNCGQVFDQQCSSKSLPLPHYGITQEVRVCDGCYNKLTRKADKVDKRQRPLQNFFNASRPKSAQELEDAELQRAIELSLQEARTPRGYAPSFSAPSNWQPSAPPTPVETPKIEQSYSYRPAHAQEQVNTTTPIQPPPLPKLPVYDLDPLEADAILTFNQTVEQVEANGGRDLSRYPAVTDLYEKANSLRPKLALSVDDAGRKEQMLSEMHEKLSQAVKLYDQILTEQIMHPRWRVSRSPQQHHLPQTPVPTSQHVALSPQPMQQTLHRSASLASVPLAPPRAQGYAPPPPPMSMRASAPQQSPQMVPAPSVVYTATQQPQQSQNLGAGLGRSNTIAHTGYQPHHPNHQQPQLQPPYQQQLHQQPQQRQQHQQTQQHQQYQQPQQYQQYQPPQPTTSYTTPNNLPQFPLVPTTAPMPTFNSPHHNGVVQSEERTEALLIDL